MRGHRDSIAPNLDLALRKVLVEVSLQLCGELLARADVPDFSGDVKSWVDQPCAILATSGVPASALNRNAIALIIQHESSGDPTAINLTDSNAQAGHFSKCIMQFIDSTFAAHALPVRIPAKPITRSGPSRSPVPGHGDHPERDDAGTFYFAGLLPFVKLASVFRMDSPPSLSR